MAYFMCRQLSESLQSSIAKGATVMLTSGIYAVVVDILEDRVVVATSPGNEMTVVKAAIRSVESSELFATPKPAAKKTSTKAAAPTSSSAKPAAKKIATTSSSAKK